MLPIRDDLPTRSRAWVSWALLGANVVLYVWERWLLATGVSPLAFLHLFGLVPRELVRRPDLEWWTVLTSMFFHDPASVLHLAGNMLFLWVFADNVEDALGRPRFVLLYVASGVGAAFAQLVVDPTSAVPMIGASGAIAGVLAAYGTLFPRAPVVVLNPIPILWFFAPVFLVPAWVVILEFFAINLLQALLGGAAAAGGGVAVFAHLGGFVVGLLLVRPLVWRRVRREEARWTRFRYERRGRRR